MNISLRSSFTSSYPTPSPTEDKDNYADSAKSIIVKKISWLLIFAYTALLFKPVMPVFMDVLAHTFWEQQHLMTVHEVNGKFHVHYELTKAAHQSDKEKQAAGSKYESDDCCMPVVVKHVAKPALSALKKTIYQSYSCFYPFRNQGIENPPPEC